MKLSKIREENPAKPSPSSTAADESHTDTPARVRLHITPFNQELLKIYIPPSLLPSTSDISYHTLQTFPEKSFGYVELPVMEAQKLKKKLNGSILKGSKVRIEEAKPEKRKLVAEDAATEDELEQEKPKKKAKKAKKENGVIEGYELTEGRKVKRGWTESPSEKRKEKESKKDKKDKKEKKDKKSKREPSKYTTEPELLFRTKLPPNVAASVTEQKDKKKKKSTKPEKEVVVHEFENTTKHASFLKKAKAEENGKVAHEYVEGKGWIDEEGDLIEEETEAQRKKRERKERKIAREASKKEKDVAVENLGSMNGTRKSLRTKTTDHADTTSRQTAELPKATKGKKNSKPEPKAPSSSPSASSISSPEPSSDSDSDSNSNSPASPASLIQKPTEPKQIHPLEALFKRPKLTSSAEPSPTKPPPIDTSFSFFGGGVNTSDTGDGEEDEARDGVTENIPQTPFTRQDLEWRGMRSAAPTPDTAAVLRRFSFSRVKALRGNSSDEHEDGDEDGEDEGDATAGAEEAMNGKGLGIRKDSKGSIGEQAEDDGEEKEESEFSKWFWENRGENNRAWKKRRREALKVRRKRENRRVSRRVV